MEDPLAEVPSLVLSLCTTSPSYQRKTLETYFLPSASFTHPFVRTGSFQGSRWLIWQIYRWYKIMSPRIDMVVDSVAWDQDPRIRGATDGGKLRGSQKSAVYKDEDGGIVYVGVRQKFGIWFVPFYGKADVRLVAVLHLEKRMVPPEGNQRVALTNGYDDEGEPSRSKPLYYVKSQQDLYQLNDFVKFGDCFGVLGLFTTIGQLIAALVCSLLALIFWPMSWVEENLIGGNKERRIADVVKG